MDVRRPRSLVTLDIINRTLTGLARPGQPALTAVHFEERRPLGKGFEVQCHGHFTLAELAERIHRGLYGTPVTSPASSATAGDGATTSTLEAYVHLNAQPWYPARPGDVVHIRYCATVHVEAFAETYAVQQRALTLPGIPADLELVLVHHTAPSADLAGWFASGPHTEPLTEIWTEAGPHNTTVVRDGLVVHPHPAAGRT